MKAPKINLNNYGVFMITVIVLLVVGLFFLANLVGMVLWNFSLGSHLWMFTYWEMMAFSILMTMILSSGIKR